MAPDPFKPVRDHVDLAGSSLAKSLPRTQPAMRVVRTIQQDLAAGDSASAQSVLPTLIEDLKKLKTTRPGVATGTDKLKQSPAKELVPGVGEAIRQLEGAAAKLDRLQPKGM